MIYLEHGLEIDKPVQFQGQPGSKIQVPMGQSIVVRVAKNKGD